MSLRSQLKSGVSYPFMWGTEPTVDLNQKAAEEGVDAALQYLVGCFATNEDRETFRTRRANVIGQLATQMVKDGKITREQAKGMIDNFFDAFYAQLARPQQTIEMDLNG